MEIIELFTKIVEHASLKKFSDIHISQSEYPIIRDKTGEIEILKSIQVNDEKIDIAPLEKGDLEILMQEVLTPQDYTYFMEKKEIDASYQFHNGSRYRVNCYDSVSGYAIALRYISQEIPSLESLGFGDIIKSLCSRSKGLVLMTGPTGVGKSTNLAAMIQYINTNFKKHIITVEDPIEYVFHNKLSLIHQREVGMHTESFAAAMKSALREDPDIIMVGEMRDPETIRAVLTLAETGHLVFSTLHTNDTVQSVDRIVDVFPEGQQEQIRMQLAMSLLGIIAQRLLPHKSEERRIPAREILLNNDAVRNLIITGNTHQLYSVIEIGQKQGMVTMDNYLLALYEKGYISKENLLSYARDKENIEMMVE